MSKVDSTNTAMLRTAAIHANASGLNVMLETSPGVFVQFSSASNSETILSLKIEPRREEESTGHHEEESNAKMNEVDEDSLPELLVNVRNQVIEGKG